MTIHQIECFLEAAKTLNFTEAASRLYISQQGLSRQIASLEKELELRLFDRTTRDVRLTRSGELLLWRWKDIPAEIKDSVDMAREEGERAKSRINLAVVGMNGIIERAGSLLADYMAIDPDTEFEINEFTCIKDMTNGTDLVFLIGKGEHFQALPIVMVELLKADMNPLICYQCQLQAVDVFVKTGFLEDMLLP